MTSAEEFNVKNCAYYFFDDMVNNKSSLKKNQDRWKAIEKNSCLLH